MRIFLSCFMLLLVATVFSQKDRTTKDTLVVIIVGKPNSGGNGYGSFSIDRHVSQETSRKSR